MTLAVENEIETILSIAVDYCRQHRLCWIVRIEHSQSATRLKEFGRRKERVSMMETRVSG